MPTNGTPSDLDETLPVIIRLCEKATAGSKSNMNPRRYQRVFIFLKELVTPMDAPPHAIP